MTRGGPKLANDASEQARQVHAFLVSRRLTMRGWASRAGLSANVIGELFSGRTRSLTYATILRLATAAKVNPSDIVGEAGLSEIKAEALVRVSDVFDAIAAWARNVGLPEPDRIAAEIVGRIGVARNREKLPKSG